MDLHDWADVTVIATTLFGVGAYVWHKCTVRKKKTKLEEYLKQVKTKDQAKGKKGQHSIYHLVSHTELTQDEIIQACFDSRHIICLTKPGADGSRLARDLLFEYVANKDAEKSTLPTDVD